MTKMKRLTSPTPRKQWRGRFIFQNTGIRAGGFAAALLLIILLFSHTAAAFAFYADETDLMIAKVIQNTQEENVSFGFITDLHVDDAKELSKDSIKNQLSALVQIANRGGLDFIALGGDLYSGYGFEKDKQPAKDLLFEMLSPLEQSEVPVLILKGNHDDNSYYTAAFPWLKLVNKKILSDAEYQNLTNARFNKNADPSKSYFYVDLKDKNTRIICLNASDYPLTKSKDGIRKYAGINYEGYAQAQLKWLVDTALTEPDKKYIVLSHMGTDLYSILLQDELNLILKSLHEKTVYTGSGTSRDFSGYRGLELFCSGHAHAEKLTASRLLGGAVAVSVGSAIIDNNPLGEEERRNGYYKQLGRVYGSPSESLFDIIISKKDSVLCLRFGAGNDRIIHKSGLPLPGDLWKEGWRQENDARFYYAAGAKHTGWLKDGGLLYYLGEDGAMQTGWLRLEDSWLYLNPDGSLKTGWLLDGDSWYYLDADGKMKTGWLLDGGDSYYLDAEGKMATGWLFENGAWYYLQENGAMTTGTIIIEGKVNNFSQDGVWLGEE